MGLLVGPPQALDRDVGVELGGRQRSVPEQLLHEPQVRTSFEQVGSRGVAESVWTEIGGAVDPAEPTMHHRAHRPLVHPAAPDTDEQGLARVGSGEFGPAVLDPGLHGLLSGKSVGH